MCWLRMGLSLLHVLFWRRPKHSQFNPAGLSGMSEGEKLLWIIFYFFVCFVVCLLSRPHLCLCCCCFLFVHLSLGHWVFPRALAQGPWWLAVVFPWALFVLLAWQQLSARHAGAGRTVRVYVLTRGRREKARCAGREGLWDRRRNVQQIMLEWETGTVCVDWNDTGRSQLSNSMSRLWLHPETFVYPHSYFDCKRFSLQVPYFPHIPYVSNN